jgi:hypothetical protein
MAVAATTQLRYRFAWLRYPPHKGGGRETNVSVVSLPLGGSR